MIKELLKMEGLINGDDIYPNGNPVGARVISFRGVDACTLYNRRSYHAEEFEFLKQYAAYHLSAPCYKETGVVWLLAPKFLKVVKVENFYYLTAKALCNKIDIFK